MIKNIFLFLLGLSLIGNLYSKPKKVEDSNHTDVLPINIDGFQDCESIVINQEILGSYFFKVPKGKVDNDTGSLYKCRLKGNIEIPRGKKLPNGVSFLLKVSSLVLNFESFTRAKLSLRISNNESELDQFYHSGSSKINSELKIGFLSVGGSEILGSCSEDLNVPFSVSVVLNRSDHKQKVDIPKLHVVVLQSYPVIYKDYKC